MMPAATATIAQVKPARRNKKRARREIDGRTKLGMRVRELADAFRERLGADADDKVRGVLIERAARMSAWAEHLAARAISGDDISPDDVIRANRAADLCVRRLRLDERKQHNTGQRLADIMAEPEKEGAT
jgi:hypothetical protein